MSRKKQAVDKYKAKLKKATKRMNPGNKPKYISKAKRAEMELEEEKKAETEED